MFILIFRHVWWIVIVFICILFLIHNYKMKSFGEFNHATEAADYFSGMDEDDLLSSRQFRIGCSVKGYSEESVVFLGSSVVLEMVADDFINLGQCINNAFEAKQNLPTLLDSFRPTTKVLLVFDPWWFDESQGDGAFNPAVDFDPFGVLRDLLDYEFLVSEIPRFSGIRGYHANIGKWGIDKNGNLVAAQGCESCFAQPRIWQLFLMQRMDEGFANDFANQIKKHLKNESVLIALPPVYLDGYPASRRVKEFYASLTENFKTNFGMQFVDARNCWPVSKELFRDRLHMNRGGSQRFLDCIGF